MDTFRRPADDLLDLAGVLLLVQGAILIATSIEALLFGIAFAGAAGPSFVLSVAAAGTLLVARVRLRRDRSRTRRSVYAVEGIILATLAVDMVLAVAITGAVPPPVALLTRFVLPLAVIALLRRSTSADAAAPTHADAAQLGQALERAS